MTTNTAILVNIFWFFLYAICSNYRSHICGVCPLFLQNSDFLQNALTTPWTLSTSQTPQQQIATSPDCSLPQYKDKVRHKRCKISEQIVICNMYSGPSLSGHSQQRPPSLMWPQIIAVPTINVFTSPSHQRPPL